MSAVAPSSEVPMACIRYRTRSCAASRRWISATYSLALTPARPSASTVRSAVATPRRLLAEHLLPAEARAGPRDVLAGVEPGQHVHRRAGALLRKRRLTRGRQRALHLTGRAGRYVERAAAVQLRLLVLTRD